MKVIVHLISDEIFEGDAPIFDNAHNNYLKGFDSRLRDIGFWLDNWRYAGQSGPNSKSRVFISWLSAKYIIELE